MKKIYQKPQTEITTVVLSALLTDSLGMYDETTTTVLSRRHRNKIWDEEEDEEDWD